MPTYDYVCENCEYKFEKFQSIKARPLRKCPECGKPALNRLVGTGSGIIFKGSGFYQTDYRTESYKQGEKSEKGKPETTTKEKKSETKDSKSTEKTKPGAKDKKKSA